MLTQPNWNPEYCMDISKSKKIQRIRYKLNTVDYYSTGKNFIVRLFDIHNI